MPNSTEKILKSAAECFFQHGYTTANVTMISRYSGISRVTIHKQFTSKDELFRAVVRLHINENIENLTKYRSSNGNFWQETESLVLERCKEMFEEIPNALVRADLIKAGQALCNDIIEKEELESLRSIRIRLLREIEASRLTLDRINMSLEDFAKLIESAPLGLAMSVFEEDNVLFVQNLIKVFKESTSLK